VTKQLLQLIGFRKVGQLSESR